jgi:hypothetical protein
MPLPSLLAYLLVMLVAARPSGHIHDRACWESPGEYEARVARHIDAAAAQVYSSDPVISGPWGHERTLLHVLAIAHHESYGWCRSVDTGARTGDNGRSVCAMGIMLLDGRAEGYTRAQLLADPAPCYSAGLTRMRLSWGCCGQDPARRLQVYASGRCDRGARESRDMMIVAWRWWGKVESAWKAGEI